MRGRKESCVAMDPPCKVNFVNGQIRGGEPINRNMQGYIWLVILEYLLHIFLPHPVTGKGIQSH